jgi:repressor LexA
MVLTPEAWSAEVPTAQRLSVDARPFVGPASAAGAGDRTSATFGEGGAISGSVPEIPFLGRIAAGQPIEALPGDETLEVPAHLLGAGAREHYVLQVDGQSMIDEGVLDGDYVVVRRREQAEAGEMIVALIEGDATLKRYYPEGRRVRLQPANAEMEPIWVDADQLQIQGIVVGLMRRF